MQRLASLTNGTSRLIRVAGTNYFNTGYLLIKQEYSPLTTAVFAFNRSFASKTERSQESKGVNAHADLYKPSTAKEETHVPDELHSGQPIETIESISKNSMATGGKVWSNQDSSAIHVAPLNRSVSAKSTSESSEAGVKLHEPTVHSAHGHVKAGGSIKIETAPPAVTPAQLAEAAAASAFEPFAPNTPLTSTPIPDATFAPKISSVDTYSNASSPTSHFDSPVPGTHHESKVYETSARGKVFGGQDTSASSKKHPKENPFNTHEKLPLPSKK